VAELAAADVVPGGSVDNLEHVSPWIDWSPGVSRVQRLILADAQTSGGLLIAVAPDDAERLIDELVQRGVQAARVIGRFTGRGSGRIRV
jgi:selenide,water dikinase